jgi:two-component system NtrC family sensor kinase
MSQPRNMVPGSRPTKAGSDRASSDPAAAQDIGAEPDAIRGVASPGNTTVKTISDHILASITRMTKSVYGFYGLVDAYESVMTIHSWSDEAMRDCSLVDKPQHFSVCVAGVWGEAIRRRTPLILNDYATAHEGKKRLPAGHVPLGKLLVVPVFSGGRITAVAAVANRPSDYSQEDVDQLTSFFHGIQAVADEGRAEERLAESNQTLTAVLEHTHMMVVLLDCRFNFVWVNRAYADASGHELSFFPGRNHFDLYPDEENQAIFQRVADTGEPFSVAAKPFEFPDQPGRGTTYWDWSLVPVTGAGGAVNGLVFTLAEVTERIRAGETQRRSQVMLARTESIAHVGSWEWDVATDTVTWSDELFRILRRNPADGAPSFARHAEIFPPADMARLRRAVEAAVGEGAPYGMELCALLPDGETRVCLAKGQAEMGPDGRAVRLFGSFQDITERKRDEEALRSTKAFLDSVINAIADPVFVKDDNRRFVLVNDALCAIVGHPREGLLGEDGDDMFPREQVAIFREIDTHVLMTGEENVNEESLSNLSSGEVRTIVTRKTRYIDSTGNRFLVGVIRDITDRKQLEIELGQARKLEAVGQLAAGIAHEINTPAQYVGDNVHFLKETFAGHRQLIAKYQRAVDTLGAAGGHEALINEIRETENEIDLPYLDASVPGSIDCCLDGISRISTIVRAMKEFAHPGRRENAPADLNHALQNTLTIARNEYKYVADVTTELGELPLVLCHVGDLNQAFLNLIVNAAHAIGDVVGQGQTKGRIRIKTLREGDSVRIDIADTGSGIPESIRHRIFDPFFTTKAVGKGSGQGLAIARSIVVSKHHGSLTFASEAGKGTTFMIRLPIDGGSSAHEELSR